MASSETNGATAMLLTEISAALAGSLEWEGMQGVLELDASSSTSASSR